MDFQEKSPPNAEKSQIEVHIVEYVENKGYKYPTCKSDELKICAECHEITGFRSFRSHLKKFHKEFSQSVMDKLVKESPQTTVSKKTSMSPDDMISLVPWSIRYPELFRKLNDYDTTDKTSMSKKRMDLWTSSPEYIELSDFLVKMTKNSGELVPQGEQRLASEYIKDSGSTRTISGIRERIRNFRWIILENDQFDTNTKVKLVFLLSVSLHTGFLEKIRQTAHVELDEENRLIVYKSETLNLQGDHSAAAKMEAYFADKKRRKSQKSSKTVAPPASGSENESISEIEEPPKHRISAVKSENKRSESVRIRVSGCPVTPKPMESDSESDETNVCEEEKYCREEYEEDTGEEEESDESSNNSEDESISKMEEPPNRHVSDSESENEAENSEESKLTEKSSCDEEDIEDCSVDDEEKEEEEKSEIHQTPPFRPQTANGNEPIPPSSHMHLLKTLLVFVSNLDLPVLNDLKKRIVDRILEIERFETRSQERMTINEIRTCLMVALLIVTENATSSSTSSSTESMISLSNFLHLFKNFVVTLKWESLENFEQKLQRWIEKLGEQDKKIPSGKVEFALQTIIAIVVP